MSSKHFSSVENKVYFDRTITNPILRYSNFIKNINTCGSQTNS